MTPPRQRPGCIFSRCSCIQCSRIRNGEPPSEQAPTARKRIQSSRWRNTNPHQNTPQSQTKTQRHTTHGRRFRNGTPPSEQASKPRKCIQSSRLRNSKPPSEHAPKPDKNQTKTQRHTAHEKCLASLSEALKKEDYYTAKATTRLHLEKMGPDASASNVAASATANHPREQAPTARKRIQSSRFRNSKPPSNHAPKPDKNQTKTQHHTAHEKCLTSLSEALKKEDYYTAKATTRLHLEKMGPDAYASNVTASATANVTSLARSPWNDGVGGYFMYMSSLSLACGTRFFP